MEFMEPKDIDWNRVVSRYVRDETYEGIAAPHWADLTDPNAGRADIDDEAWFCRPGTCALFPLPSPPSPPAGTSNATDIGLFGDSRTSRFLIRLAFLLGDGFRTPVLANPISAPPKKKKKSSLCF